MKRAEGTVVVHTELGNYCLKEGLAAQYRLWLILRSIDKAGSCYVPSTATCDLAEKLDQTPKRLHQVIQKGMNIFWKDEGDGLRYTGRVKLGRSFGLDWLGDRVQLDDRTLYAPLKHFKAAVYAANFVRDTEKGCYFDRKGVQQHGGKTISRATITQITGLSRPTQYEYEEMMGIKVDPQFAYAAESEVSRLPIMERVVDGSRRGVFHRDINNDGKKEIVWQVPNRYSTEGMKFLGRTKKIVRPDRSNDYSATAGRVKKHRTFYSSPHTFRALPDQSVAVFTHQRKGHLNGRYMRFHAVYD